MLNAYCMQLSDWEVEEAHVEWERGTAAKVLAQRYGVSAKTLYRAFRRLERKNGTGNLRACADR